MKTKHRKQHLIKMRPEQWMTRIESTRTLRIQTILKRQLPTRLGVLQSKQKTFKIKNRQTLIRLKRESTLRRRLQRRQMTTRLIVTHTKHEQLIKQITYPSMETQLQKFKKQKVILMKQTRYRKIKKIIRSRKKTFIVTLMNRWIWKTIYRTQTIFKFTIQTLENKFTKCLMGL